RVWFIFFRNLTLGAVTILEKPCDFDTFVDAIRQAYEKRMIKRFEHDQLVIREIQELALGQSPLGILRALSKMEKDEK
ncbi:MAG: hypothetical protein KKC20_04325, partial [Proteobacteria bacterium]|nr:hypothetical protein [Pseudomonadota bacterium]